MRVLVVHEVSFQNNVQFEYQQFPHMLAERGHEVYVIDYDHRWSKSGTWDLVSKRQEVDVACSNPQSSVKLIHPSFIKVPVLSRASAWVDYWQTIEQTIKEKRIDVIILYSVPTNGVQTVNIAKKYGVPVIFRSIDTLNQLVKNPLLSKVTKQMERYVYSQSDLILTICPTLSRYVTKMGARNDRVKILPLGVDTEIFRPDIDTSYWRDLYQLPQSREIIVFVGTLPRFCGLGQIIRLLPRIIREAPESMLIVVGNGEQSDNLERIVSDYGLEDYVILTGYQSFESIPEYINLAKVCINPFELCGATRDIFPTKIIQYMACGKPVVSTPLPGLFDMVRHNLNGVVYANNEDQWVDNIVRMLKSDSWANAIGRNGLEYVRKVHSYDKVICQLERELKDVT